MMIGWLLLGALALAQSDDAPAERGSKGERGVRIERGGADREVIFSGRRPGAGGRGDGALDEVLAGPGWWKIEKPEGSEFDTATLSGVEQLGLDPRYIQGIRDGLHLAYLRDYPGARAHFIKLGNAFPGTGIAAAVDTVIWQAIMLENWDFRHEKEYLAANKKAQDQLEAALEVPGSEGWEHFLLAGVKGIEAIHTMRRGRYLPALQTALDAMGQAGRSREASPDFVDLFLADGMYNYWRTVITESTRMLPDFGDKRAEGVEQMGRVEREGVFVGPAATLSLSFSHIEDRDYPKALAATRRNERVYPDNIINLLVMGQVQTYHRRFDDAQATWDRVLEIDPENQRVLYWRGVTYLRAGKSEQAIAPIRAYLDSGYLEKHHQAWAHYRLGEAYYRQKRYVDAESQYIQAVKLDGHKSAKSALDRMRAARREGRISY